MMAAPNRKQMVDLVRAFGNAVAEGDDAMAEETSLISSIDEIRRDVGFLLPWAVDGALAPQPEDAP